VLAYQQKKQKSDLAQLQELFYAKRVFLNNFIGGTLRDLLSHSIGI
jgi:hypothetical protein